MSKKADIPPISVLGWRDKEREGEGMDNREYGRDSETIPIPLSGTRVMRDTLRILIADGSRASRRVLRHMLEDAGYEITETATLGEAMTAIESDRYDVLVTDLYSAHMPDPQRIHDFGIDRMPDGVRLIEHVRISQPDLPIIAVSGGSRGMNLAENLERAVALGADAILAKPVGRQEILDAIHRAFAHKGKGSR
jgi:CheY-like chemotaxis protein